ncbi:MAG: DUF2804 domain-containing protein [Spirochaetales bacterium]|nr:DUF2804 domain-containing protein [Spirochaetales bacterium]
MREQIEIKEKINLLDSKGHIIKEGWGREPFWQYDRRVVKAPWFQIKEWDYYIILSEKMKKGISFTISDLGYAGLMALCWVDMDKGLTYQADTLAIAPRGRITAGTGEIEMTPDSGNMQFCDKVLSIRYETGNERRKIIFEAPDLEIPGEGIGIHGEILLKQPKEMDSMNIATSWKENRKRFYYNRKINGMPASGFMQTESNRYDFHREYDTGTLDWGRGAWTYRNQWYWGSASGYLEGTFFGFNIGYGFTDRSPASENALFYGNAIHKLEDVVFHIKEDDYMAPWKFTSSDGRFELDFKPVVDRQSEVNLLLIRSIQHQVFGYFTGKVRLDDGKELELKNFPGFAEDVYNRY